jgi:hypothetical protein
VPRFSANSKGSLHSYLQASVVPQVENVISANLLEATLGVV